MSAAVAMTELPADLLADVDREVGSEKRAEFFTEVAQAELRRRRMLAYLRSGEPAWKDEDHPELAEGSYAWVRKLRAESEGRVEALAAARNLNEAST